MENILTPAQMRKADACAIDGFGIPSGLLMENAARSAFEYIAGLFYDVSEDFSILLVCGSGNNGGDGFALARHLHNFFKVDIIWIGSEEKMSPETHTNFIICRSLGINMTHISDVSELDNINWNYYNCIIDSMIGVGGSENIRGIANDILKTVNSLNAFKIAVDAPTGLNTLTGKAGENCFRADLTITMYAKKLGLLIGDGPDYCGEVLVANLGAPVSCVDETADTFAFDTEDLSLLLPGRNRRTSKFDYGRLVIIAGSKKFPGAGALSANAAIKSGVGLVELFSEVLHPAVLPEVICHTNNQGNDYWVKNSVFIKQRCDKADAVLIGPGLGQENVFFFEDFIENLIDKKKVIVDADALSLIDKNKQYNDNLIILPHIGEFARITGDDRGTIDENAFEYCKNLAKRLNCIVHLKHYPSISSDGNFSFLTLRGNPGMASGGSGDVLAGITGAMAALGFSALTAAGLASFVHAAAGDYYKELYNEITLTASDLIDTLPYILNGFDYESDQD